MAVLKGTDWDPRLDEDGLQHLANYWEAVRSTTPFESGLKSGTAEVYRHEIPGGQYSNYRPQVAGLGLLDKWEECKDMYRKVNLLFGDVVKVTPSSKVVGDMAMFLVKNGLEPEELFGEGKDLAFPSRSWASRAACSGSPRRVPGEAPEGDPEGPGAHHLPPRRAARAGGPRGGGRRRPTIGGYVDDKALVSWLLYPNVYPELVRHRDEYSDTSFVPTPVFLYGLEPGQETTIEIEPGKTLIVRLVNVGKLEKDGTRDLHFELNGERRAITVRDRRPPTAPSRA